MWNAKLAILFMAILSLTVHITIARSTHQDHFAYPDLTQSFTYADTDIKLLVLEHLAGSGLEVVRQWDHLWPWQWPSQQTKASENEPTQRILTELGDFTALFILRISEVTERIAKEFPGPVKLAPDPIFGYKHSQCLIRPLKCDAEIIQYFCLYIDTLCHVDYEHLRLILSALDSWRRWNKDFKSVRGDSDQGQVDLHTSERFYTDIHHTAGVLLDMSTQMSRKLKAYITSAQQAAKVKEASSHALLPKTSHSHNLAISLADPT